MISILYVDDESALLDIAKRYLERTGTITVETAESAQGALDKIAITSFDAIISDYLMPGMDGIEFLKVLRSSGNSTPFIIFTGKGREDVVIRAFNEGADFYIQKGGEPKAQYAELVHKVKQAVELRKADAARRESEQKVENIIGFLPDATFAIDMKGRVIAWNRAIEEMTGISAADMVGKGDHEYALPFYGERRPILIDLALQDHDEVTSRYSYVRREGGRLVAETTGARLQGKEVVLWGMATSLYDSQGRMSGAIESIRDITAIRRSEEALRKREEQLALVIEGSGVGTWDWQVQTGTCEFNERWAKIVGYTIAELSPVSIDTWVRLCHPDDLARSNELLSNHFSGEIPVYECEARMNHKDGSWVWVLDRGKVVEWDPEGRPIRMTGTHLDITDRKRAEEALAIAREKFTKAFLAAPDAITVSELESGRFIEVNDAASAIFGYSREEIIGKSAAELGIWRNKADRQALIDQIQARGQVSRYEVTERRKSGEQFLASVNADTMTIDGTRYLIAIIRDISDQKGSENALRESRKELELTLDATTDGIWKWDFATDTLEFSPRYYTMLGYQPDEFPPNFESWLNLIHPDDRVHALAVAETYLAKKPDSYENEFRLRTKSGEYRWIHASARVVERDASGAALRMIGSHRDITERKHADEALRESEGRYHNIIEDQTEFICRFLPDGTHVFVNGAYARYFGKEREDLIGHVFRADIFPGDRERFRQFFTTLTPEHPADFIEHRIVMPDGQVRWQRWSDRAIFNENGKIVEYQSVGRDITEHKQIEAALRESENRYRNVVEDQTEFVCRFRPDGTHVFVNEAYCRNFNKSRSDIIGHVFIPDIPEEDREIVRQHFRSLTPEHPVATVAHRIILPGGSIHWQRWSDRAIFDKSGNIVEYQSVGRDITEQKQIEAALRDSEQLMLEIINHLPDPTFAINRKGEVIAWNKAIEEFLGIQARDMIGKGNYEYAIPFYGERQPILIDLAIHPDEDVLRERYDDISRRGETLVVETTIAHPQGRTVILWAKASPLYDKSGSLTGAIETIRDITERKHEEMKLRHVNRQLNLLSGITRHDILNQLLVLKGYLDLSRDVLGNPITLSEYLMKEEDAASTIEELILFTREYHDLGVKKPEWQNVSASIVHAKTNLPLEDIAVETDGTTLEVFADPLFSRVFYNLMDNALRYGGERMTTIRFSSRESDTGIIIVCEDDGAGVPAGKNKAIFNREFYQHTGFGLYLSREILGITGISIVENGEPGKGARFEIAVPKDAYRFADPGNTGK